MELSTPSHFWEHVKIWYENKDIRSKIEVKDILRLPPPTPHTHTDKDFEDLGKLKPSPSQRFLG